MPKPLEEKCSICGFQSFIWEGKPWRKSRVCLESLGTRWTKEYVCLVDVTNFCLCGSVNVILKRWDDKFLKTTEGEFANAAL